MFGSRKRKFGKHTEKLAQRFAALVNNIEIEAERVVELTSQYVAESLSATPIVVPKPLLIAEVSAFLCFRTDVFLVMAGYGDHPLRKALNLMFANEASLALDRHTSDSRFRDFFNARLLIYTPWAEALYSDAKRANGPNLMGLYGKAAGYFYRAIHVHHNLSDLLEDSGALHLGAVSLLPFANAMETVVFTPWLKNVLRTAKELRSEQE